MQNDNLETSNSKKLAIALFRNPRLAEHVYSELLSKGYKKEDITVMMSEETQKRYFLNEDVSKKELGSKSLEGMGIGGAIGGTIGAIAAVIAAMGTALVIPGLGIVVAGALAAGLAGAGAGAVTGGLMGALIGLGISDEQTKEFEAGIKEGGVVIGVYTRSLEEYNLFNDKWKTYQKQEFIM